MPIARNTSPGLDTPRAALLRAGLAGLLMVVLLYFVLTPSPEQQAVAPMPPVAEAPPPALLPPEPDEPLEPEPEPEPITSSPASEPLQIPPLPSVEPPVVQPQAAASAPVPAPKVAPPSPPVKPAGSASHVIHLADFVPLPQARNLLDSAVAAGQPGRILHRVLVGPFASRDAALQAESGAKGLVVEAGGKWWVQAGVFSDAGNADRQRAALAEAGKQVVVHGRPEAGPFATRAAADQALGRLRAALGQSLKNASIAPVR